MNKTEFYSGKCLDTRVVSSIGGLPILAKGSKSSKAAKAQKAHRKNMKMSVLVEVGLRRMRYHTRGMDWETSRKVMSE